MKRRKFIQNSGVAAGALLAAPSFFTACSVNDPMSRIGLTTVVFRNRFLSTNPNASGDLLTLEKIPEYYRDRFGIYQPEFWSEHFESREPSYLKELKEAGLIQGTINPPKVRYCIDMENWEEAKALFTNFLNF